MALLPCARVPYWESGIVIDLLILAALLGAGALLVRIVPVLRRLSVPNAIVAGLLGLAFGPSGLGWLPTDIESMELLVYHSFAILFIAVGLQAAPKSKRPGAARSLAVANATIGVSQAILGMSFVAAWLAIREALHPGFGLLVTLGFQQGPGQALALGGAWEQAGMADGAQLGLIFATLGFIYCIVFGVPLVALARRRGWIGPDDEVAASEQPPASSAGSTDARQQSGHEPLAIALVVVGCVYLLVFLIISGLVSLLPPGSKLGATLWGMHFILGSLLAIAIRSLARRGKLEAPFDDRMLARVSVVAVDITTAGAIAAVQLEVLSRWLAPVLLMTATAGLLTLLGCIWLARRAFPEAPFAHALVLFGLGTGTVSTGLALLRMLDPQLRGTVARNAVIGATASVPFNAPLFLLVIPITVGLWTPENGPSITLGVPLAILSAYLVALLVCWRVFTPLRLRRPLAALWPDTDDTPGQGPGS